MYVESKSFFKFFLFSLNIKLKAVLELVIAGLVLPIDIANRKRGQEENIYYKHKPVIYQAEVILNLLNANLKDSARSESIVISTHAPFRSRGLGIQGFPVL